MSSLSLPVSPHSAMTSICLLVALSLSMALAISTSSWEKEDTEETGQLALATFLASSGTWGMEGQGEDREDTLYEVGAFWNGQRVDYK